MRIQKMTPEEMTEEIRKRRTDFVEKLLALIDPAELTYSEWLRLGMKLHKYYGGDKEVLQMWTKWSVQEPGIEEACKAKWASFGA